MAAEIPDGAVLVARAILNSSLWTQRMPDRILAITCICVANWRPRKIWFDGHQIEVGRGQFIRSIQQLAEASRLTVQNVRSSLNHLISTGFLTRIPKGQSYLYTVSKYDKYQDLTKYADSEWQTDNKGSNKEANKAPTRHQQGTNNKQEREECKEGGSGGETPEMDAQTAAEPDAPPLDTDTKTRRAEDREMERTIDAFSFCGTPGLPGKIRALQDLVRQGVTHASMRDAAAANPKSDFFEIVKLLRNGKAPDRAKTATRERPKACEKCGGKRGWDEPAKQPRFPGDVAWVHCDACSPVLAKAAKW